MSDLYTVTLLFRGSTRQAHLVFDDLGRAENVFAALVADAFIHSDDYGTKIAVAVGDQTTLEAVILQDVTVAQDSAIELGLVQARSQAKAAGRANHDPVLRFAQRPPVLPG